MRNVRVVVAAAVAFLSALGGVFAFQIPEESRLDRRAIPDPSLVLPQTAVDVQSLAKGSGARAAWDRFLAEKAGPWRVMLDGPAGAPLLVEGPPIPWSVHASLESLPALERSLRAFAASHRDLLLADDAELVLDPDATGPMGGPDGFQVVFSRAVRGVPVRGDRYVFLLGRDNLVTFGASRWTRVDAGTVPTLDAGQALEALAAYAGAASLAEVQSIAEPRLELVPRAGAGKSSALVWTLVLSFAGERGTWVGLVDAHDGQVRGFFDDVRYAQVKGGIHPESGDGACPSGCQQPNFPMPFARVTLDGAVINTNTMGLFTCQPAGATATTELLSATVRISDACGPVLESVTCDASLDLGAGTGTNCSVAPGASAGNTKASRSCFYAVNRLKEHARAWWLTNNNWLNFVQTTVNTNVNSTCNANWNGSSLNMFRDGNGCANTCVTVGVASHEWGHGLDQNDGGGFDNTSEAYGDISEFLTDHTSCVGRGFTQFGRCSGYGDSCLTCTGIRDMDWAARAANTPATPAGFLTQRCPNGGGPCGKEEHCEAYVAGETIWDLAARDLPASGLDQDSAWQLADRLWYRSRAGSGGNMYSCALPNASGCGSTTLFTRIRAADDDDGNMTNGTPHAAAIFAAFSRHGIACGQASDASNQSTTVCSALVAPAVTATGVQNAVQLSWAAVPGAASYRILRNDVACDHAFTIVASVPSGSLSYTDTGLANDFPLYYRVQAVGTPAACESPVSTCQQVTPQIIGPYALSGTQQLVVDACSAGGAGGNGIWDAGETVRLNLPLSNAGSQALTGLKATISTATPGVEILDGTAAYPDIAPGNSAGALAPYFTIKLGAGIACGTVIPFDVQMTATGGSWSGFFSQKVGGPARSPPPRSTRASPPGSPPPGPWWTAASAPAPPPPGPPPTPAGAPSRRL